MRAPMRAGGDVTPSSGRLLLATTNRGKADEFRHLLPPELTVVSLADVGLPAPAEDGTSFAEIAAAKAIHAAQNTGLLALADDSGLEVDALGGEPGIRSARYAGDGATDAANRTRLLDALRDVPPGRRSARFRCAIAVAEPDGVILTAEGICEGTIATGAIGDQGFGYDPVFALPEGRTMAQLDPAEKNRRSHRARAFAAILPALLARLGLEAIPSHPAR